MAAPAVVRVAQRFKAGLLAGEHAHQLEMARRYLTVERALVDKITLLAEEVTRLKAAGQAIPIGRIYRLERWQQLDAQLLEQLARFNGWTMDAIAARQQELGRLGVEQAQSMLRAAGLTATFDRLPLDAVEAMVGFAGDGAPLSVLLAESYPATADAIGGALVEGVALGRHPSAVAQEMTEASAIGLDRAFLIARTEELRAHRTATQAQYIAAGVTQYQRVATLDDETCIGCLAADGELFDSEQTFDSHPACRCACAPVIDQPFESRGEDWFNQQDEGTQEHIMGIGRLEAYESGAASWDDMWVRRDDDVWGGAIVPANLSELVPA